MYGVKPDAPEAMEYEHNIMETAHPNSCVIAPAYDRLNGLVENNIERQNINLHIVQKTNTGLLTQHKYAENQLLLSLVRVANDLDNKDKTELRILADTCLGQLHAKTFHKTALIPLALAVVSSLIGALYFQQHMDDFDNGLKEDYDNLNKEINDLLNSNTNWGVGSQYDDQLREDVSGLQERINKFYNQYQEIEPVLRELERPKDSSELLQQAKNPETQSVIKAYQNLRNMVQQMDPYLDKIQQDFSSEMYKQRHTQDKGIITSLIDKTNILHGGKGLIGDDFDDVVHALAPFRQAIKKILDVLATSKSIEGKAHADLAEASAKSSENLGDNPFQNVSPEAGVSHNKPGSMEDQLSIGGLDAELNNAFGE
jgi:hypothetical protein